MGSRLTRIAPTPSGFLHIGNMFSFSLTAALARREGARVLLRIDDMDRERVQREYVQDIFDTLRFMEIPWDEGPRDVEEFEREYSQVHRLPLYRAALARLRDAGAVYACACSRAQVLRASPDGVYPGTCRDLGLDLDAEEVSWRLRTSAGPASGVSGAGNFASPAELPAAMRDFVVRKKDGFPAYQLTSVVDDLHYGIDLIVRGQDLWASTLAQYYLSYALGADAFREIRFYHHPLLTAGGGKLSKSAGATSIRYLRRQGMKREDIYALIARFSGFGRSGPAVRNWEDLAAFVETRASRLQS